MGPAILLHLGYFADGVELATEVDIKVVGHDVDNGADDYSPAEVAELHQLRFS